MYTLISSCTLTHHKTTTVTIPTISWMISVCQYGAELSATATKSLQSCLTLCDPIDGGPPGSPVPGILQARTLEWAAISSSSAWKWKVKVKSLSLFQLLATPWTAAYQAPKSVGFSRQEYCSGLPLPSPKYHTTPPIMQKQRGTLYQLEKKGRTWMILV